MSHPYRVGGFNASALVMDSFSDSLVFPIRIFRMFQVPERAGAEHCGNGLEVVLRRRRRGGPLERPRIPRVITRLLAVARRPKNVPRQAGGAGDLKDDSDGGDQI